MDEVDGAAEPHAVGAVVAGWVAAGTIAGRDGHPWVIAGDAFAARLRDLTGVEVTPR